MSTATDCPKALVVLTKARKMLAEARSLDDWQGVRSVSKTALAFVKSQRDMGMEARNEASEIMLIAERRMGEMLSSMDGKGTHGGDRKSSSLVELETVGIGPSSGPFRRKSRMTTLRRLLAIGRFATGRATRSRWNSRQRPSTPETFFSKLSAMSTRCGTDG